MLVNCRTATSAPLGAILELSIQAYAIKIDQGWMRRSSGQSRQPQVDGSAAAHQGRRRQPWYLLHYSPDLDPPSFRYDQALDANRTEAHHRGHLASRRQPRRSDRASRMPQLLSKRRLCFRQNVLAHVRVPLFRRLFYTLRLEAQ